MRLHTRMGVLIAFMAMSGPLAAQQTITTFYKDGTKRAQRLRAIEDCMFRAAQNIPPAMATRSTSGAYDPGSLICNSFNGLTVCNNVGAFSIPGTSETVDLNVNLRHRFYMRCMADKGYVLKEMPICANPKDKTTETCVTRF